MPANLRAERADLQIDDDEAAGRVVVEEQVEDELLAADLHPPLTPGEVEALAEREPEPFDVAQQRGLEVALPGALGQLDEVQDQRIAGDSLHGRGVARLERPPEVGDRRRLAMVQPGRDGGIQLLLRPGCCSLGVPVRASSLALAVTVTIDPRGVLSSGLRDPVATPQRTLAGFRCQRRGGCSGSSFPANPRARTLAAHRPTSLIPRTLRLLADDRSGGQALVRRRQPA